jgi:hypothetical protein
MKDCPLVASINNEEKIMKDDLKTNTFEPGFRFIVDLIFNKQYFIIYKNVNKYLYFKLKYVSSLGVPNLGDASHWGDARSLISVISWVQLYQWGDADTKRNF